MDANHDHLLTSSDYEHIINDLHDDSPFQQYDLPLQVQVYGPVQEPLGELEMEQTLSSNMEVAVNSVSPTSIIPCRDNYPGPLEFEIYLDSATANRKSWLFSHKLNKVFIDINKSLLVKFRVNKYISGLFVRALPVYSAEDFVSEPVQRCTLHEFQFDTQREAHTEDPPRCFCDRFNWVRHVIQSKHSQVQYHYDSESNRHSVVVPLEQPPAGVDFSTVEYHFTCKTSCSLGMNRKPIDVIFTLESEHCEVLGRQILAVKICSCPKRDKEKEEVDEKNNGFTQSRKRPMSALEKQKALKKVKEENNFPQQVEPVQEPVNSEEVETVNNTEKNSHNEDQGVSKLLDLISAQSAQLVELRNEIQHLKVESSNCNKELRKEIHQLKVELSEYNKGLENKLETICHALKQGYMPFAQQ